MSGVPGSKRFAYAFYATDDTYAIAVIVLVRLLRRLGVAPGIDLVIVHLPLAAPILATMRDMGMITIAVERLPQCRGWYFRDCLVKLRIFQLTQYDRLVYLDADTIPLKSLDSLFTLPFEEPLAAPLTHWLDAPEFSGMMLVVKPSETLWQRAARHFPTIYETGLFDGPLINLEFEGEIHTLPTAYGVPSFLWADARRTSYLGDPDGVLEQSKLVHFYELGKPWRYHPDRVPRLRPKAHPDLTKLWRAWWQERERLIAESPPALRRVLTRRKALDRTVLPKLYDRSRYRLDRILSIR